MRKYNISVNLVCTIEQLYDKAASAVQMNGSIGECFRTTVRVRQGCLLSPTKVSINLHRVQDGDQCGEDQTDDKQCQWHPERDKGKRTEVGHCNKLQVPWGSYII